MSKCRRRDGALRPAHVSFASSHPSSAGPCGTVLNAHLIAPVLASAAIRNPPAMKLSESEVPRNSVPLKYFGGWLMR